MKQRSKERAVVYIRTGTTDPKNPVRIKALEKGWRQMAGSDFEIVKTFSDFGDSNLGALNDLVSFCADEMNKIETVIMAEAESFGKDVVEELSQQGVPTCHMELRVIRSFSVIRFDDGEMAFDRNDHVLTDIACEHNLVENHVHYD